LGTWGGGGMKLYYDRELVATNAFTGGFTENTQNPSTGALVYTLVANEFDGLIDEVKVWNYALTAEQVRNEYNNGSVSFGF
jgi:hypothetical protein